MVILLSLLFAFDHQSTINKLFRSIICHLIRRAESNNCQTQSSCNFTHTHACKHAYTHTSIFATTVVIWSSAMAVRNAKHSKNKLTALKCRLAFLHIYIYIVQRYFCICLYACMHFELIELPIWHTQTMFYKHLRVQSTACACCRQRLKVTLLLL